MKRPDKVNMVIFRENTEDIYAGIEFQEGSADVEAFKKCLRARLSEALQEDPVPGHGGIGIKPISRKGSERLVRAAMRVRHGPQA